MVDKKDEEKPMTVIPITKDQMISALYGIGGTIKSRADYKDQAYSLVQELIQLVEDNNE